MRQLEMNLSDLEEAFENPFPEAFSYYLGRLCQWRECGPGLHRDCDAQHCGRRPYLHDDLETVRLPPDRVAAPPLELWPRIVIRGEPPVDVLQTLVEQLEQEQLASKER